MARFAATQGSNDEAINTAVDVANQAASTAYNEIAAATAVLTVAQVINGILNIISGAASSLTFPTAALIVAALKNAQVGSSFDFTIINGGSGTATVVAGAGNTLKGFTAPATLKSQKYTYVVTNATLGAEAGNIVGFASAGV